MTLTTAYNALREAILTGDKPAAIKALDRYQQAIAARPYEHPVIPKGLDWHS